MIRQWFVRRRDVWLCALVVTIISCAALWRMGLLWPSSAQDTLPIDTARTAYVARNIVEGNGYTTNDMPAAMVSYYDQIGRLHEQQWANADRFPFAAYATALLYTVTGRSDPWTGIILYNLIAFVAFLTALYVLTKRLSGSKVGGAIAVSLALLHNYTYLFLFVKDADMLLLSTLALLCFHRYFSTPFEQRSPVAMAWFGTVLAWAFLARPNLGTPFVLALLVVSVRELVRASRSLGLAEALRIWVKTDVVAGIAAAIWVAPFVIHNLQEWGSPFFSTNGIYQPMLGTRYAMNTDNWWHYVPKDYDYSAGHLWRTARAEVIAKFTTSWFATVRAFLTYYFADLALAFGALMIRPRPEADDDAAKANRTARRALTFVMLGAFTFNFLLLPFYSFQGYPYRHYLGFALPLVWAFGAGTVLHIGRWLTPVGQRLRQLAKDHPQVIVAIGIAVIVLVGLRAKGVDGNLLLMNLPRFFGKHWLLAAFILVALLAARWWRRWSAATWLLIGVTVVGIMLYRPHRGHKIFTHQFIPATPKVWTELRKRDGLVASFALQTLVPWNTGRRNVIAPDLVMSLYEMVQAHQLEFEDIFIESPEVARESWLFNIAAPGIEGYERITNYPDHLPGYRLAYHEDRKVGRPRFTIKPIRKTSIVYTLADRAAIDAILKTPTTLAIGEEASVVHTAYGFGGYYKIDGRSTVAATDVVRDRYPAGVDAPWEDTGITFFVDDNVPTQVTIKFYTLTSNTFTFYWNLDLYDYTPRDERARHQLGVIQVDRPGWQTATFKIPAGLTRRGLNKLGFRAAGFEMVALCGNADSDLTCLDANNGERASRIFHADTEEPATTANLSMFIERLELSR